MFTLQILSCFRNDECGHACFVEEDDWILFCFLFFHSCTLFFSLALACLLATYTLLLEEEKLKKAGKHFFLIRDAISCIHVDEDVDDDEEEDRYLTVIHTFMHSVYIFGSRRMNHYGMTDCGWYLCPFQRKKKVSDRWHLLDTYAELS